MNLEGYSRFCVGCALGSKTVVSAGRERQRRPALRDDQVAQEAQGQLSSQLHNLASARRAVSKDGQEALRKIHEEGKPSQGPRMASIKRGSFHLGLGKLS